MNGDRPEVAAARARLTEAIEEFVRVTAAERGEEDDAHGKPVTLGWVAFAEYSSMGLMDEDATSSVVMVPDSQIASTSRGLYEFGVDAFSRRLG